MLPAPPVAVTSRLFAATSMLLKPWARRYLTTSAAWASVGAKRLMNSADVTGLAPAAPVISLAVSASRSALLRSFSDTTMLTCSPALRGATWTAARGSWALVLVATHASAVAAWADTAKAPASRADRRVIFPARACRLEVCP